MKDSDSVGLFIKLSSENATKELKNLNSESKNLQKNLHSLGDEIKYAFNSSVIIGFVRLLKNVTNTMINAGKAQTEYIENLHLLQVAYGETNSSGEKLVKSMADLSGLDISQLTKSLGKYRQLSNALGIASDSANILSENLLKMQNDIASLYNLNIADVSKKLMSALTGETEAIKILGADITTISLQQKAYNLGIQESVTNMSQAEKTILRYLIVQDQLASSQGDFANTINSVANQTKIWNAQLGILGRQLGSIFNAILKPMLPILNGILMAINTIIGTLLGLLGIKTNVSSISDDFLTLGTNISNAGKAGKEANKSLRGFDKLNVIKTPTSSSSGGAGGIGGGVNPKLLAQLKEYNDMLAEANNKATKIRDTILEWLGFGKDANGEWKFMEVTFGTIAGIATVIGTIIATFAKIGKVIRKITKIFGITSKATSFLITLKKISGVAGTIAGVFLTIDGILKILDGDTLQGVLRTIEGISLIVAGIAVLFGGWTVAIIAAAVALVAYITELIVKNWDKIKEWLSGIWDTIHEKVIQPIVDFLTPFANWIYDNVIQPIIDFFSPIFDACWDLITSIYDSVKEIISGIIDAISSIFAKIWEIAKKIIEIFVEIGKAFYNYVIKPIWEKYIKPGFQWIYNTLIKPIINLFADVGTWVYNHIIKPIWDGIKWLKDKAVGLFKSIGTAVIDFISGSFKAVINGVLTTIERNINRFIKLLNGSIKIINNIPGVEIDPINLIAIPKLADGGFPNKGDLFIANEKAPEYVGSINNKPAVANQNQIVDGISTGVARAMLSIKSPRQPIVIEATGDTEGLLDFIQFKEKDKDRQYGL